MIFEEDDPTCIDQIRYMIWSIFLHALFKWIENNHHRKIRVKASETTF